MRILALVLSLVLSSVTAAFAVPAGWSKLMTPADLAAVLAGEPSVRVLHVGGAYGQGHVPGAVEANIALLRGPGENPGAIPPIEGMTEALRAWGIAADVPVVVVHGGIDASEFGIAARVYWTLKSLGVRDLAILNGGLRAWEDAGLPVSTEAVTPARSTFEPVLDDQWQVTTEEVRAIVEAPGGVRLVDARPEGFFLGTARHPAQTRPGTIAGADSVTFVTWFDGPLMLPKDELRALAQARGLADPGVPVVAFCNTGIWAAATWFALSEVAEIDDVRLYASSIVEWSQAEGRMANVPSRVEYYWWMFSTWVAGLAA